MRLYGPLAQLVEQFPFKEWVTGSNPVGLTNNIKIYLFMKKTTIQNIETGIKENCDSLKKNDQFLEVVLEGTTIKILLKNNYFLLLNIVSFLICISENCI